MGAVLAALVLVGCVASREAEVLPDQRFGHRPADGADGRDLVVLVPPDSSQEYFFYPALFDTLHVRPASLEAAAGAAAAAAAEAVPVEVLVKGSFPDACMELHAVEQERIGHLVNVELLMRRPRGSVCASVVRPYRFYFLLDGAYAPGAYTLKLNGTVKPFVVAAPAPDAD